MKLNRKYFGFIEQVLSSNRLKHSLGVMDVMGELAGIYGLDPEKARIIGLLHDAGKDLRPEQQEQLIEAGNTKIFFECDRNYNFYLHGPVGATLVQKRLGIDDELILDAIANHTFYGNSRYFNHPMCWCLRFSDILEPNRDFREVKWLHHGLYRLKELVYAGRLDEGAFLQTGWLLQWFQEDGFPIHPNIIKTHKYFANEVNSKPLFIEPNLVEIQTDTKLG